ncbi:MAG: hypothetical protein WD875_09915 [Pirellulales bacterium]
MRALIVGEYVTPQSGPHAGQLGPWSRVVDAVGITPRSTLMKSLLAGYGFAAIVAAVAFALSPIHSRPVAIAVAILGLWYLPIGTIANGVVLLLLLLPSLR